MHKKIVLTPKGIATVLTTITLVLLIAHLASIYFGFYLDMDPRFAWMFYFDRVVNIPHLYTVVLLLLPAVLLFAIASQEHEQKKLKTMWRMSGILFILLAIDKVFNIHALLEETIVDEFHGRRGFVFYAWILTGAIFTGGVLLKFMPKLFQLPRFFRNIFVLATMVYFVGAFGMDVLHSYVLEALGVTGELVGFVVSTLETLLEMIGIIIFVYGLSSYLVALSSKKKIRLTIDLRSPNADPEQHL